MFHMEKLFSKSCGLCGKKIKEKKLQHKCGILPQTNS